MFNMCVDCVDGDLVYNTLQICCGVWLVFCGLLVHLCTCLFYSLSACGMACVYSSIVEFVITQHWLKFML